MALAYTRALLKISGEALAGEKGSGLDFHVVEAFAEEIKAVHALGVRLALVVGGGNIIRGATASREGLDRVSADYMGMLATVINALALQDVLEKIGVDTRVMTAIRMESLAEPYIRRRAIRHLENGRLIIFAAGTGNPLFSTDTAGRRNLRHSVENFPAFRQSGILRCAIVLTGTEGIEYTRGVEIESGKPGMQHSGSDLRTPGVPQIDAYKRRERVGASTLGFQFGSDDAAEGWNFP